MRRSRLGMFGAAILFAVAGSGPVGAPLAVTDSPSAGVRSAADGFSGVSGEPQMGDLASVRVSSDTDNTVAAPTFELSAPARTSDSSTGSASSTTSPSTPTSGRESTRISGSGSFNSSQGRGGASGQSSGSSSSGSSGSNGSNSEPDPDQLCTMPAMC